MVVDVRVLEVVVVVVVVVVVSMVLCPISVALVRPVHRIDCLWVWAGSVVLVWIVRSQVMLVLGMVDVLVVCAW